MLAIECLIGGLLAPAAGFAQSITKTPALGGHPKPAIRGHLKTGQRYS